MGAAVKYLPPSTRPEEQPGKASGTTRVGVFGGYELEARVRWTKLYYVWILENFANMLLRADVDVGNIRLVNPARVRTIATTGDGWVLPLRAEYECVNRTLDGTKEKAADPSGDRHQQ